MIYQMITTTYFEQLIDDFGIWQHGDGHVAFPADGYALDDATRGLILCLLKDDQPRATVLLRYLAASYIDGQWYGYADADRRFWGAPASEDAIGQVAWVAGFAYYKGFLQDEAKELFELVKASMPQPKYIRGTAYALLGALYLDHAWADELAADMRQRFAATTADWPWPEEHLNYGNAILPYALLRHAEATGNNDSLETGERSLAFIDSIFHAYNPPGPVGNQGWYHSRLQHPPQFSQQPIDVAYMIWALMAHYHISGDEAILARAEQWMTWFHGTNVAGETMIDEVAGLCRDGIDGPDVIRVSDNSGAESTICYYLTVWCLKQRATF